MLATAQRPAAARNRERGDAGKRSPARRWQRPGVPEDARAQRGGENRSGEQDSQDVSSHHVSTKIGAGRRASSVDSARRGLCACRKPAARPRGAPRRNLTPLFARESSPASGRDPAETAAWEARIARCGRAGDFRGARARALRDSAGPGTPSPVVSHTWWTGDRPARRFVGRQHVRPVFGVADTEGPQGVAPEGFEPPTCRIMSPLLYR